MFISTMADIFRINIWPFGGMINIARPVSDVLKLKCQELTVHLRGQDLWGMQEFELTSDKPIPLEAHVR